MISLESEIERNSYSSVGVCVEVRWNQQEITLCRYKQQLCWFICMRVWKYTYTSTHLSILINCVCYLLCKYVKAQMSNFSEALCIHPHTYTHTSIPTAFVGYVCLKIKFVWVLAVKMLKWDESCQKSEGEYALTHTYKCTHTHVCLECINIKKIRNWVSIKNTRAQ